MSHEIKLTFQPICMCCGAELKTYACKSKALNNPLEVDTPSLRTKQFVFTDACQKCFLHKRSVHGVIGEDGHVDEAALMALVTPIDGNAKEPK